MFHAHNNYLTVQEAIQNFETANNLLYASIIDDSLTADSVIPKKGKILLFMHKGGKYLYNLFNILILNGKLNPTDPFIATMLANINVYMLVPAEQLLNTPEHFTLMCTIINYLNAAKPYLSPHQTALENATYIKMLCEANGIQQILSPQVTVTSAVISTDATAITTQAKAPETTTIAATDPSLSQDIPPTQAVLEPATSHTDDGMVDLMISRPRAKSADSFLHEVDTPSRPRSAPLGSHEGSPVSTTSSLSLEVFRKHSSSTDATSTPKSAAAPTKVPMLTPLDLIKQAIKQRSITDFDNLFKDADSDLQVAALEVLKESFITTKRPTKGLIDFIKNIALDINQLKALLNIGHKDIRSVIASRHDRLANTAKLAAKQIAAQEAAKRLEEQLAAQQELERQKAERLQQERAAKEAAEAERAAKRAAKETELAAAKERKDAAKSALVAQPTFSNQIEQVIRSNDVAAFNKHMERTDKRGVIYETLVTLLGAQEDITQEFLRKININIEKLISLLLLNISTDQKIAVLSNIFCKITQGEYVNYRAMIIPYVITLKLDLSNPEHQQLSRKHLSYESASFAMLKQEYQYLESLPTDARVSFKKIKQALKQINPTTGENALMLGLRRGLHGEDLQTILNEIPAEHLLTVSPESGESVLHYWARYLRPDTIKLITPITTKLFDFLKSKKVCIVTVLSEPGNRDLEGNTFYHTLIKHNSETNIVEALIELGKHPEKNTLLPSMLLENSDGDTLYAMLDNRDTDMSAARLVLCKLVAPVSLVIVNLIPTKVHVYFPQGKTFYGSAAAIARMIAEGNVPKLVDTIRVQYELAAQMTVLRTDPNIAKRYAKDTTYRIAFAQMQDFFFSNVLVDHSYGGLPLYCAIVDTILTWGYKQQGADLTDICTIVLPTIESEAEAKPDEEYKTLLQELEVAVTTDAAFAGVATVLHVTHTISWKAMQIHLRLGVIEKLKQEHIDFLTAHCRMRRADNMTAIDCAIATNDLVAVKFLHHTCLAPIDYLSICIAVEKISPPDKSMLAYLLDNFTPQENIDNLNPVHFALYGIVEDSTTFATHMLILSRLFFDPARSQKLLSDKSARGINPLNNVLLLLKANKLSKEHAQGLIELFLQNGASIKQIGKEQGMGLFVLIDTHEPEILKLFLQAATAEDLRIAFAKSIRGLTPIQYAEQVCHKTFDAITNDNLRHISEILVAKSAELGLQRSSVASTARPGIGA